MWGEVLKVVGLRGVIGAGKTSTATHLIERWNARNRMDPSYGLATVESFAGPIRDGLLKMGVMKRTNPDLYRKLAQLCGAECRAANPDHWAQQASTNLFQVSEMGYNLVVFDDVRYPNESPLCDLVIYLMPHDPNAFLDLDPDVQAHESEKWNLEFPTNMNDPTNENTYVVHNTANRQPETVDTLIDLIRALLFKPEPQEITAQ